MHQVQTDHQIIAFGTELMKLYDARTSVEIVTAACADGVWTVHADGIVDVTASSRAEAITAMTEHALAALGPSGPNGEGYSTMVPRELSRHGSTAVQGSAFPDRYDQRFDEAVASVPAGDVKVYAVG